MVGFYNSRFSHQLAEASPKEHTDNQTAKFQTVIPEPPVNGNTTKHHSEIAPDRKNHRVMMSLIVQLYDVLIILQIFMDHQQKNQKEMDKETGSNDWLEGEEEEDDI